MKIKTILAALIFTSPFMVLAESAELVSFGGKSHSQIDPAYPITFTGEATACICGAEDMKISAAAISFDPSAHTMACTGGVTVTSGSHTIQADKLTITLKADKIFLLNPDGIKVSPPDGIQATRDGHSLFVPSTNWKPDQGTTALLQSASHRTDDQLNWSAARAELTLPAAK